MKRIRHKDLKSLITLGAVGTLAVATLLPKDFTLHAKAAYAHGKHSARTIQELAMGTKGQRAVNNLEQALSILGKAGTDYDEINKALSQYGQEREQLVENLKRTYEENETMGREFHRLQINLEGFAKNFLELGNDVKPDAWKKHIDNTIIRIYGMDPVEAIERSEKLKEFYSEARAFYDQREINERSVKNFCDFLARTRVEGEEQNKKINGVLQNLEGTVNETYNVENKVFEGHDNRYNANIPQLKQEVLQHGESVMNTREGVQEYTPVPISNFSWLDIALNPFVLGLAAGATVKGASKALPSFIERPINTATAYPLDILSGAMVDAYKGASKIGRNIYTSISSRIRQNDRKK